MPAGLLAGVSPNLRRVAPSCLLPSRPHAVSRASSSGPPGERRACPQPNWRPPWVVRRSRSSATSRGRSRRLSTWPPAWPSSWACASTTCWPDMTWLKLSDDFGDECARASLTDAAFRTHVEALLWTMRRETEGRLSRRDVTRFGESDATSDAVRELLAAGFWVVDEDTNGYRVVHHMEHQPESAVLQVRRRMAAERQRRHRRRAAGLSRRDETRDVQRDATRDPGRVGTGRGSSSRASEIPRARATTRATPPVGTRGALSCSTCHGSGLAEDAEGVPTGLPCPECHPSIDYAERYR